MLQVFNIHNISTLLRYLDSVKQLLLITSFGCYEKQLFFFTRKGLKLTIVLPSDGNFTLYLGTFNLGNAIEIQFSNFI